MTIYVHVKTEEVGSDPLFSNAFICIRVGIRQCLDQRVESLFSYFIFSKFGTAYLLASPNDFNSMDHHRQNRGFDSS